MPLPHDSDHGDDHSDRNRVAAGQVSGTVVQIGTVHGAVGIGAPEPAPHQLPASPRLFTDRRDETRDLHALHGTGVRPGREADTGSDRGTESGSSTGAATGTGSLVVLHGTGGVGKTALATHFLSAVAGTLPDGVLHYDLLGFSGDAPADPGDVLDRFLRDLGTAPEHIPPDLPGRAAAFRSRTHGRRIGLLLDNAVSAAQVRPLLPGDGGHLVLVTTRLRLSGLRLDGAEFLELGPLDGSGSAELVERILSDGRAQAEPDALSRLTDLCGGLPLAVCAAVSGLTVRRHQPLSRLVDRLSRARHRLSALSSLSAGPEMSVETALTDSYRWLGPGARRMYRLLGLAPGRDLTPDAAGALAGLPVEDAEELLTELLTASLLEEDAGGRLRQHDLTRLHARARAEADESEREREHALDRILDHYLVTAASAAVTLNPGRWCAAPVFAREGLGPFPDRDAALRWLTEELGTLRSCVRTAHTTGRHSVCWQLCEAVRPLFTLHKHFEVWRETHETGLAAAESLGDDAGAGSVLTSLGVLYVTIGDVERAEAAQQRGLAAWMRAGHRLGQASAHEGLGVCDLARGRPEGAYEHFLRAREIHRGLGRLRGETLINRRLGEALRDSGEHEAAIHHLRQAVAGFPAEHEPYQRLRTLAALAETYRAAGASGPAGKVLTEALSLSASTSALHEEARIRTMLAETALEEGRGTEARHQLERALSIQISLGDRKLAHTRALLSRLGEPRH